MGYLLVNSNDDDECELCVCLGSTTTTEGRARPIWTTPNPNRIRVVLLNREFIALRGVDAERNVDPRAETMPAVEWTNSRQ